MGILFANLRSEGRKDERKRAPGKRKHLIKIFLPFELFKDVSIHIWNKRKWSTSLSLSLFIFLKELGILPKDDIVHLYLSMSEECEFINLKWKSSNEITCLMLLSQKVRERKRTQIFSFLVSIYQLMFPWRKIQVPIKQKMLSPHSIPKDTCGPCSSRFAKAFRELGMILVGAWETR